MAEPDVSYKAAMRNMEQAVQDLITAIARDDGRPVVSCENWVLCMDNRYYAGGEMTGATISAISKPSTPQYVTGMIIEHVFTAMNAPQTVYSFEEEDED